MRKFTHLAAFAVLAAAALAVGGPRAVSAQIRPVRTTVIPAAEVGTIWGKDSSYAVARDTSTDCDGSMRVGQDADEYKSAVYRPYARFSLASIPEGATILAARVGVAVSLVQATPDFSAELYRVGWQSSLCTWRELNYDMIALSGVYEGVLFESALDTGHRELAVSTAPLSPGGEVRYAVRSSRDALAQPPYASEWADMLPAQTALTVYWR